MVPFGESTAMSLLQVQGVAVRNRSFSLTLLPALRHLSAVCVSSPIYRTTTLTPVSRNIQSSKRRTSSVSSLSKKTMVYEEQDFWHRQSKQKHWQNESNHDNVLTSGSQQIHEKFSIKMTTTPEKNPESSLKTEQSLEFSSSHSSNGDVQTSSFSESKNLSKAMKNKISLSKTSKSTNKSRKLSRKSCKRRNSAKSSRKVPSVFERLTNSTFKSDYHSDREKSKIPSSTTNNVTMFHNDEVCGALLEIRQIQATYSPKRSTKPKTFLFLPKVPRFTKFGHNMTRTTIKKEAVNMKSCSYNSQVTSPRGQKPLKMNPRREENIVSCKKIYLSEMQSKAIGGVPSAPPGTPSSDQLKKIEYVPSLMDIKSQRAIKLKLEKIVHRIRIEEQHSKENSIKQDQKKLKESLVELKQRQRLEIYALNRVMTELENENFKKFMDKKEAVSLGV